MDDKTFSERLNLMSVGSYWRRIDDDAIGTILEIRDDNSNNLIVRWTHPSFEGTRAGEYDRYEFARKWVPLKSQPNNTPVKVDSIWKSNKTGDIVKVLIEPDVSYPFVHYINLNDTTGDQMMSDVDKAVFITEHTFLRDNDNGALYRHNKNPNTYLKVIETTKKRSIMGAIDYVKYRVIKGDSVEDGHECLIITFHQYCHLLSLDPEKDWTVPKDSVQTIKNVNIEITVGSIWRNVKGSEEYKGRLIKVVHTSGNMISWRYLTNAEGQHDIEPNNNGTKTTCDSSFLYYFEKVQDNDNGAIYQPFNRAHDVRENPGKYQMVKVVETKVSTTADGSDYTYGMIKYTTVPIASCVYSLLCEEFHSEFELVSLNPAEEVSTGINDSTDSGKRMDPNKGESKMENNNTYLRTDTSKLEDFGTGAKREDKTGKGRYDLIPGDIMSDFEDFAWTEYFKNGTITCSPTDVSKSAYFDDWTNIELYYDFMLNAVSLFFVPEEDREECEDDNGEISYEITWEGFRAGLYNMRYVLARHYEAGAAVHGVDNWKKGLPIYGSERGGCFLDSMRRHADQALQGKVDEPHATAAIWNAIGAIWTLKHRMHSAMYQNASAVKAERNDQVDSLVSSAAYGIAVNNDTWRTVDGDNKIAEESKTTKPSSDDEKFNITKWPEGVDVPTENINHVVVGNDMPGNKILNYKNLPDVDLLLDGGFNNIVDSAEKAHKTDLVERIKKYHDIKYNLANTITLLRKIVDSNNFDKCDDFVKPIYFDIYTALVILHDIIAWFHEYPDDMNRIATLVSDLQWIIQNADRDHEFGGNITLKWESCPQYKYDYIVCLGDPDEDKLRILHETIERVIAQLSNANKMLDTFYSFAILASLADFNNKTLKPRINNDKK